jgi:hypothetical protein
VRDVLTCAREMGGNGVRWGRGGGCVTKQGIVGVIDGVREV